MRLFSGEPSQGSLFDAQPVPPAFQLPQKVIQFGQQPVQYRLKRSRRKSIGLQIDEYGLRVTAPAYATMAQIEQVLHGKSDWIVEKLSDWHKRQRKNLEPQSLFHDGATFPLQGRSVTLSLDPALSRSAVHDHHQAVLALKARADDAQQIERRLTVWLKAQATEVFSGHIDALVPRLGVAPKAWGLSSAATRWGVCTASKTIRLNWRLVHYPDSVIRYVVAHELAHLLEMNHSDRFWAKVAELDPGYRSAKQVLSLYQPNKIPVFS